MTPHQQVHEFLRCTGRRPKKRLGQHFLIDPNVLPRIVEAAELDDADLVLEIGAGLGCLTGPLAADAKKVVAVEIDSNLCAELERKFSHNPRVLVVRADILKLDLSSLLGDFPRRNTKVVGNLPYQITSPILWRLFEKYQRIGACLLMMQTEVAQRIVASPGGKDYGALSVGVSYYSETKIVRTFSPNQFYPSPRVSSSLVRLRLQARPKVIVENEILFFHIVRVAFQFRRKMLRNAILRSALSVPGTLLDEVFDQLGIDGQRRGETLAIQEFASLANCINRKLDAIRGQEEAS